VTSLTLAAQNIDEPTVLDDVEQPGFFIPLVTAVVTTVTVVTAATR
jgi:hypothetical protein